MAEGLSSSLRCGIRVVPRAADGGGRRALGDQPGVDPAVVRRVIAHWRETRTADRVRALSR